jgi:hypothetical protein
VQPFCAASAAQLNISKSTGMSVDHPLLVGPEPVTGVPFVDSANQPVRHLGVLLAAQGAHVHAGQLFQQRLPGHCMAHQGLEQAAPGSNR